MKNISAMLLAVILLTLGSCKKQGPPGPAGKDGADGKDGNANIKTRSFTLMGSQWDYPGHYVANYGNNQIALHFSRTHAVDMPEITKAVVDHGMVQVYMTPHNIHNWVPLPFTTHVKDTDLNHHFTYEFRQGSVRLHYFWTANSKGTVVPNTLETYLMPFYKFRIVVAEGTVEGE